MGSHVKRAPERVARPANIARPSTCAVMLLHTTLITCTAALVDPPAPTQSTNTMPCSTGANELPSHSHRAARRTMRSVERDGPARVEFGVAELCTYSSGNLLIWQPRRSLPLRFSRARDRGRSGEIGGDRESARFWTGSSGGAKPQRTRWKVGIQKRQM